MQLKEPTTTKKHLGATPHFFTDMRFWLILLMLAAFVGYLVLFNPK